MEYRTKEPISGSDVHRWVRINTYPRGRRCHQPGCRTVLSIYNPGWFCTLHEERRPTRP